MLLLSTFSLHSAVSMATQKLVMMFTHKGDENNSCFEKKINIQNAKEMQKKL